MNEGPCGPRVEQKHILILPAGNTQKAKAARSCKRGVGGKPPMSAAFGIALIEGDPQRIFGYFLCEQKVTLFRIYKKGNV